MKMRDIETHIFTGIYLNQQQWDHVRDDAIRKQQQQQKRYQFKLIYTLFIQRKIQRQKKKVK